MDGAAEMVSSCFVHEVNKDTDVFNDKHIPASEKELYNWQIILKAVPVSYTTGQQAKNPNIYTKYLGYWIEKDTSILTKDGTLEWMSLYTCTSKLAKISM